mmetsp:Transcript_50315/g.161935  ORF Transcript_50315/g.161935 Transcript_50315/m.161935 type:complete len:283 (+) Transcript_50315:155-1003(+)
MICQQRSAERVARSAAMSKSQRRRSCSRCSSGLSSKPARISSSSFGEAACRTRSSKARCCCSPITRSAKAREGRWGSASSGRASAPHRKARSMPVASLRCAKAAYALTARGSKLAAAADASHGASGEAGSPVASATSSGAAASACCSSAFQSLKTEWNLGARAATPLSSQPASSPPQLLAFATAASASLRMRATASATVGEGRAESVASRTAAILSSNCAPPLATHPHVTPRSRCTTCTTAVRRASHPPSRIDRRSATRRWGARSGGTSSGALCARARFIAQ